jgi:hypothetical protein
MKKVRCIANEPVFIGTERELEVGKVYEVRKEYLYQDKQCYLLNTRCRYSGYWASNFVVVGCPCDVKDCIKHPKGK